MKENKITSASTSEYFIKNLQQIGFSSPIKAVLTTIKESVDNSLDACEDAGILPEISIEIEKLGNGTMKNNDLIKIVVQDNGPGIEIEYVARVFGEFLASSKFGRGRCSRGQQGLGISAANAWGQITTAHGVKVITKTKKMKKAYSCEVEVDIKNNKGIVKNSKNVEVDFSHGTRIEFKLDGKIQMNGEAGVLTYLTGTSLVNPSLTLKYKFPEQEWVVLDRVSSELSEIPEAVSPHPHTMKLGEFISHGGLYPGIKVKQWLKEGFSRIADSNLKELPKAGVNKKILESSMDKLTNEEKKTLYSKIQDLELLPPSTKSVRQIGEENLAKSIQRLGEVDFFAVVTRKPTISDFKPVQIEVAVARLKDKGSEESAVQVLRFANLVPLQFDKKACVTTQAIESVNWKAYGLSQPKDSLPQGPYIFAISIVSPFIKFKNASKETIDASEELLQEIRLALIQAGQKLAKFVKKEAKAAELEAKIKHMEQFAPILVKSLINISKQPKSRKAGLEKGLKKILGRDTTELEAQLVKAEEILEKQKEKDNYE
jgi:DNA topoisomerase-6 subunit B